MGCRAVSFDPPGEDLVGALVVLARYVVSVETPGSKDGAYSLAQAGTSAWLPLSPVQPLVSMQVCHDLMQDKSRKLPRC